MLSENDFLAKEKVCKASSLKLYGVPLFDKIAVSSANNSRSPNLSKSLQPAEKKLKFTIRCRKSPIGCFVRLLTLGYVAFSILLS